MIALHYKWGQIHQEIALSDHEPNEKNIFLKKPYQDWSIFKNECFRFIFVHQKSLKPVFEYKIIFWICVLVLWIHRGFCEVKKLVWNVRIKAFWYIEIVCLQSISKLINLFAKSNCDFDTCFYSAAIVS